MMKGLTQDVDMPSFQCPDPLRWLLNRLLPAGLGVAILVWLWGLWLLGQQMEPEVFNLFQRWSARPATNSPVVLVLIDDRSLSLLKDRFGAPPWPRHAFIDIFSRINRHHPELMVLDSHFIDIRNQNDAQTFVALRAFSNLITGLVLENTALESNRLNTALPAYYQLNLGVVSVQEDADGLIRTLTPIFRTRTMAAQSGIFPALSLAAAYEYKLRQPPQTSWLIDIRKQASTEDELLLYPESNPGQGVRIPLTPQQSFYLRWYQPVPSPGEEAVRSHEAIPLWRFFQDEAPADLKATPMPDIKGKIALLGASASYYRDYHQTPIAHRHLGPDIQATAIDNILRGDTIRKAPPLANACILLAMGLLVFLVCLQIRRLDQTLLYTLGLTVIYFSCAFRLFDGHHLWLDVVTPEAFMGAAFLAGNAFRMQFKEKQLAAMEKTLAQLVDPEIFREIRRRAHVLKPGGQKLEITSLFVDIRQFTSLSERLQPVELTGLLNEFYEAVVKVVFYHHGTVDKFMGDGILIIFGAPLAQADHRAKALLAAQDLLDVTGALSAQWQETQGIDAGIGISLHSGVAFVGFLGPVNKLEYTAVGDTVNTCVRLQELTKQFKTRLIVSEQTLHGEAASNPETAPSPDVTTAYVELGEASVRGREATIRIFTRPDAFYTPPSANEATL
jgi:adenylate cyclase